MKQLLYVLGAILLLVPISCKNPTPVIEQEAVVIPTGTMLNYFYIPQNMLDLKSQEEEIKVAMLENGCKELEAKEIYKGKLLFFDMPEGAVKEGRALFDIVGYVLEDNAVFEKNLIYGKITFGADLMAEAKSKVLKEVKDLMQADRVKELELTRPDKTKTPALVGINKKLNLYFEFTWSLDPNNAKHTILEIYIYDISRCPKDVLEGF